jgi:hypothetical protein
MPAAVERIVVQATPQEKRAIMAKARRLGLPLSELMRRGAAAYESAETNEQLGALADRAKAAADRASAAIDAALEFVAASNRRIAALETRARGRAPKYTSPQVCDRFDKRNRRPAAPPRAQAPGSRK